MLQSKWEELLKNERYEPVYEALEAGLRNIAKWYRKASDTSIYFISHGEDLSPLVFPQLTLVVLDPTWKLSYVQVAWDAQDVEDNMDRLRKIVGGLSIFLCSACLNLAFYLVPQISYKISCCKEGSTTCCRCRKYN